MKSWGSLARLTDQQVGQGQPAEMTDPPTGCDFKTTTIVLVCVRDMTWRDPYRSKNAPRHPCGCLVGDKNPQPVESTGLESSRWW